MAQVSKRWTTTPRLRHHDAPDMSGTSSRKCSISDLNVLVRRATGRHFRALTVDCQTGGGAGHDAVSMAEITEVALLIVRCREGLSHHPEEYASPEDIALAVEVLTDFRAAFPPS